MKRRGKILLGIFIPIIVIFGSFGGYTLWKAWPAELSFEVPILDFPVANTNVIHILGGYGYNEFTDFHNGLDFGCNTSVNILAPCDVRVTSIRTWFNDLGGHWQTSVNFKTTWKYELAIYFESWALNTTFADLQREQVPLEVGQKIAKGEIIGQLLYHGDGCHIHFGLKDGKTDVCPYQYLSTTAKATFDDIFAICGFGGVPCNETVI